MKMDPLLDEPTNPLFTEAKSPDAWIQAIARGKTPEKVDFPQLDDEENDRLQGIGEYEALKTRIRTDIRKLGIVASPIVLLRDGLNAESIFVAGFVGGYAYYNALAEYIDTIEDKSANPVSQFFSRNRFLPIVFAFAVIAFAELVNTGKPASFGMIPISDLQYLLCGLLVYQVPILFNALAVSIAGYLDASGESAESMGSLGLLKSVADQVQRRRLKKAPKKKHCLVLTGAQGVGKSTLLSALSAGYEMPTDFPLGVTTRPRLGMERNGSDYIFLDNEQFSNLNATGQLLAPAQIGEAKYAIPKTSIQPVIDQTKICLLNLDVEGVKQLRNDPELSNLCYVVHVKAESDDTLRERLRASGITSDEEINAAVLRGHREVELINANPSLVDTEVVNGEIRQVYDDLQQIMFPAVYDLVQWKLAQKEFWR
jgi:guanylate kinase